MANLDDFARLPEATTTQQIDAAPPDLSPCGGTAGVIAHNRQPVHVYAAPGAAAIAWLAPQQHGSDTWLPVVGHRPGWAQVLLPSRPNGASGWIPTAELALTLTPQEVRVHRESQRLQLFTHGRLAGTWRIHAGVNETSTPAGRTFLLAATRHTASTLTLALGSHGNTPSTCTAAFGTVAIHALGPQPDQRSVDCHTCIRVPPVAMDALSSVPLGSLVRVYR